MTLSPTSQALTTIGKQLMERRGVTAAELSTLMLAILAVAAEVVSSEGQEILRMAQAQLESEGKTQQ